MIKCPHISKSNEKIGEKTVSTEFPFELVYRNTLTDWLDKGLKSINEASAAGVPTVALDAKQKSALALFNEAFPATGYTPKANEKAFISRDEAGKTVHPLLRPLFLEVFHGDTLTQQVATKAGGEFANIDSEDLLDACKALRKIKSDKAKYSTDWIINKAKTMLAD
jgi:hypothetical protein